MPSPHESFTVFALIKRSFESVLLHSSVLLPEP